MYCIQIDNCNLKGTATITYVHRTCQPVDLQLGVLVKCMLSCDIYSIKEEFFMNSRESIKNPQKLSSQQLNARSLM